MHDVTEGGVLGAVGEMCGAGGCGAVIWEDALPVDEATARIAGLFDFDPVRTLGSGALLMACRPGDEGMIIQELAKTGVSARIIGHTTPEQGEIVLKNSLTGQETPVTGGRKDPYWGAYLNAVEKGWR